MTLKDFIGGLRFIKKEDIDDYKKAKEYIEDNDTKVFINYNNELGIWLYSIEVVDSDNFWLSSFETLEEAKTFICKELLNCTNYNEYDC